MVVNAQMSNDDRLVTVTGSDSTPNPLQQKITSSDNSISLSVIGAAGANQQLDLRATAGIVQKYDEWTRCTQASAGTTVSLADWRGMVFHVTEEGYPGGGGAGSVAAANAAQWNTPASPGSVGHYKIGVNYAGADILIGQVAAGANGSAQLFLQGGTGNLYIVVGAFTAEFQARFVVEGFARKSAVDRTI